jgi:hypothetical protein
MILCLRVERPMVILTTVGDESFHDFRDEMHQGVVLIQPMGFPRDSCGQREVVLTYISIFQVKKKSTVHIFHEIGISDLNLTYIIKSSRNYDSILLENKTDPLLSILMVRRWQKLTIFSFETRIIVT